MLVANGSNLWRILYSHCSCGLKMLELLWGGGGGEGGFYVMYKTVLCMGSLRILAIYILYMLGILH